VQTIVCTLVLLYGHFKVTAALHFPKGKKRKKNKIILFEIEKLVLPLRFEKYIKI
jgi:hypothetical protein